MSQEKPESVSEYKAWLKKHHNVVITSRTKTHYDSVARKIKADFQASSFWTQLVPQLREFNGEYLVKTGFRLFVDDKPPEVVIKPFDSFLLKTLRKNVLENVSWPNEPKGGWVLPINWVSRIGDVSRTLLVVKYLDGVEFIVDRLKTLCEKLDIHCLTTYEARWEGYYAAHVSPRQIFEIPKENWDTEKIDCSVEIQVSTQLQEVIRRLLHRYYEERRKKRRSPNDKDWRWDYQSEEFAANYLGHILHYVEGMIVDIREKQTRSVP